MRKGFSLVELLVVLGIMGVLILAGTDFLVQVVRNANRAAVENEVRQNASKIMQDMVSSIRGASCVDWEVRSTPGYPAGNGDVVVRTYSDNCVSKVDEFQFVFDPVRRGVQGIVLRNGRIISSPGVAVISCPGTNQCATTGCVNGLSVSGTSGSNAAVTLGLAVQSTTSASQTFFCATTSLSNSVTPRVKY